MRDEARVLSEYRRYLYEGELPDHSKQERKVTSQVKKFDNEWCSYQLKVLLDSCCKKYKPYCRLRKDIINCKVRRDVLRQLSASKPGQKSLVFF